MQEGIPSRQRGFMRTYRVSVGCAAAMEGILALKLDSRTTEHLITEVRVTVLPTCTCRDQPAACSESV